MERLLNSLFLEHDHPDTNDILSFMVYLTQITESNCTVNEFQIASKILHNCLLKFLNSQNILKVVLNILQQNHDSGKIDLEVNNFKLVFRVNNKWFFQILLLSSLVYVKRINANETTVLNRIISFIYDYTLITNNKSIFLIKSLENILSLDCTLVTIDILHFLEKISVSPIESIKFYSNKIMKFVLSCLNQDSINEYLNVKSIPRRCMEAKYCCIEQVSNFEVVQKILKLFQNNIHNKDGGFLYKKIVEKCSFDEWCETIWPIFLPHIRTIEFQGESFQSFLKYWIPISIVKYRTDFAKFVSKESIHIKFVGYVLLEARRSGYYDRNIFDQYLTRIYFYDPSLVIGILCTYNKKTLFPQVTELNFIRKFAYSYSGEQLSNNEFKSLQQFVSQIFLVSHNYFLLQPEIPAFVYDYAQFFIDIFKYCNFNMKNGNNIEVVTQILLIINTIGTGSAEKLCLPYKLEQNAWYDNLKNRFYLFLKETNTWYSKNDIYLENIATTFLKGMGHSQGLTSLIISEKKLICKFKLINCIQLKKFVKNMSCSPSLQNTEKVNNYTKILFEVILFDEKIVFLNEILSILEKNEQDKVKEINKLFEDVLLLEILLVGQCYTSEKFPIIMQKSMNRIEQILDKDDLLVDYIDDAKSLKVLEAYINNVMTCFIKSKYLLNSIDKYIILKQLCKIIRISNMKRPVTLAIEVLKHLGALIEEHEYEIHIKIYFISEVFQSILDTSSKLNVKIRRSPESRLVLHAMCVSEKPNEKIFFPWIFNFLLDLISEDNMKPSAISSSLHTLEILISDCNLFKKALPYLPYIIEICMKSFKVSDWLVRNADLQLAKAVIERTHGVSLGYFNRPRDIVDVFQMCPSLTTIFCDTFRNADLDDSAIIALQFFLESQIKSESLCNFLELINEIVVRYPTSYGKFAIMAYIALVKENDILYYFTKVKNNILSEKLRGNNLWNYIKLLKEFYIKYMKSYERSINNCVLFALEKEFKEMLPFLGTLNPVFLSLMCICINNKQQTIHKLKRNQFDDFEKRIFEFNNIPYVIYCCNVEEISFYLQEIFSLNILDCTEVNILKMLINRYMQDEFSEDITKEILGNLTVRVASVNETGNYLLNCYYEVVSFFHEIVPDVDSIDIVHSIRFNYERIKKRNNIHQILILLIVLSNLKDKVHEDRQFIKFALSQLKIIVHIENKEVAESLSFALKYLYRCVVCNKCKYDIFIIAFILIMKHELYDFFDFVTGSKSVNALDAFLKLNGHVLSKHLPDNMLKYLLYKFYIISVNEFQCGTLVSESFYVKQKMCFINKTLLLKLLSNLLKNI